MQRLRFGRENAPAVHAYGSEGLTIAPLTAPIARGASVQVACFRLDAGGRIGRHPATVPQLLVVVSGSGRASGADGVEHGIGPGDAVFWDAGEEHETRADEALTAIVIEGETVAPFAPP